MSRKTQFRILLPVIETFAAILVGGVGLWQRHQILNQRLFGDQTLWESTARYHVWPLPYRFAVISNIPAFLAAAILQWPVGELWPQLSEVSGSVLFVLFVPVIWYLLGSRLDSISKANERCWAILLLFTALAVAAMFTPGYVGYFSSGCILWIAFGAVVGGLKNIETR
jgi:hypothetical protein